MTGIELPDQLAGVQGAAPLGGFGAAPRWGRGAAPPKQNAKMHSKLPVRSSGHSPLERRIPGFSKRVVLRWILKNSSLKLRWILEWLIVKTIPR
ncbi:hypothetical protein CsSME_00014519 [Camellia sinensis var. sinensis]